MNTEYPILRTDYPEGTLTPISIRLESSWSVAGTQVRMSYRARPELIFPSQSVRHVECFCDGASIRTHIYQLIFDSDVLSFIEKFRMSSNKEIVRQTLLKQLLILWELGYLFRSCCSRRGIYPSHGGSHGNFCTILYLFPNSF